MKKYAIRFLALLLCLTAAILPSVAEETAEKTGNTALVSFVGDISIGDSKGSGGYHNCLEKNGLAWPFSLVVDELEKDDLTVGNLEVLFTERKQHRNKMYPLKGKPEFVECLKLGSVEVVNTVNNHCLDYYIDGYKDTLKTLDDAGVGHFGCMRIGQDPEFDDLYVTDLNGIRFGFFGFSYPQTNDQKKIAERITRLREQGCDVVVVSLHWGKETHKDATSGQASYAKKILDAGADMIFGHHAHVIQQVQFYNGKLILFNTGNFTFGTMSSVDPATGIFQTEWEKTEEGTQLKMLRVIPCRTQLGPEYRPYILTEEADRTEVFKKLIRKNAPKGLVNLPESFAETGTVYLDHGEFVTE